MIGFATRRIVQAMIVMLVVALLAFTMFRFVGDPINQMVGIETSIEEREALRERLGLNDPVPVQFFRFVTKAAQFDFGTSYQFRQPVSELFAKRIPATLELSFASAVFALVVGIPMGIYAGLNRESPVSKLFLSVSLIGISLGLVAGYMGGRVDAIIMRIADVQLTFPAILIALLIDGVAHGIFGAIDREIFAFYILIVSLALSFWVQYARTVRGSTMVEKNKEYVQAARVIGIPSVIIMVRHILPNVTGPVLVIATINLALAIVTEATLSFLGVGMPPTQPSLGTLIAIGNDFLYSGEWWIAIFPGLALALLVLNVNLLGDWLRDALNPKLR